MPWRAHPLSRFNYLDLFYICPYKSLIISCNLMIFNLTFFYENWTLNSIHPRVYSASCLTFKTIPPKAFMVCLMQSCVPIVYGLRSLNQHTYLLQNIKKVSKTYKICLSFLLQMHFFHLLFFIFTAASVASLSFDCNNDFLN